MKIVNYTQERVGKVVSDMELGEVFKWQDEYFLVVEMHGSTMRAFNLTMDRMGEWELGEERVYGIYAAEVIVS